MVPKGSPAEVEQHTVRYAEAWPHLRQRRLTKPLRIVDRSYGEFVDKLGNGEAEPLVGPNWHAMENLASTTKLDEVLEFLHPPNLSESELARRHILAPHAATVAELNREIQQRREKAKGDIKVLRGRTFLGDDDFAGQDDDWASHALRKLSVSNVPNHELELQVGDLCTLMRNVSREDRLLNNTKCFVRAITPHFVHIQPVDADGLRDKVYPVPRFLFKFRAPRLGLPVYRRQFPLRVSFAMTINRAQGQTFDKCILDLRASVFSHGQLYVALGRVRRGSDVLIYGQEATRVNGTQLTRNVISPSLLSQCRDGSTAREPLRERPKSSVEHTLKRNADCAARAAKRARRDADIVAERDALTAASNSWVRAAVEEARADSERMDEEFRLNRALLVEVDHDLTIADLDDPEYYEWLKDDDEFFAETLKRSRRFVQLEADGSSSSGDTAPSVAFSASSATSSGQSTSDESEDVDMDPPHDYFVHQSGDTLCGVYAVNHILGGPVLTRRAATAGAKSAARTLREPLAKHCDTTGTVGDMGGDYSLMALAEALSITSSARIDFTAISDRLASGVVDAYRSPVEGGTSVEGYLVHRNAHWTAVKFHDDMAWFYDSLHYAPRVLTDAELTSLLSRKAFQVYSL